MIHGIEDPHGIMFHHFHDENHPIGQGSISSSQLDDLLNILKKTHIILEPYEWFKKSIANTLKKREICITLDDNLKCQIDIAEPVFRNHGISAFWFVYSSPLINEKEYLEIFRFFRSKYFSDFDSFFKAFMQTVQKSDYEQVINNALKSFDPSNYLKAFPFYSTNDRIFRFLRDHVLNKLQYDQLMISMINEMNIDVKNISENLWNAKGDLLKLSKSGHFLGLHSHSHPTNLKVLPEKSQLDEYHRNNEILSSIINQPIKAMSHPCNSYNEITLEILQSLGIKLGFRSNMKKTVNLNHLEYPRIDHSILIKNFGL